MKRITGIGSERPVRRALAVLLVLGGITALFALVYHPAFVGASATSRQLPVYSVERDGKFCALSFDAAWGNEDTPELINEDAFQNWIIKVELSDASELDNLMDAQAYAAFCEK